MKSRSESLDCRRDQKGLSDQDDPQPWRLMGTYSSFRRHALCKAWNRAGNDLALHANGRSRSEATRTRQHVFALVYTRGL